MLTNACVLIRSPLAPNCRNFHSLSAPVSARACARIKALFPHSPGSLRACAHSWAAGSWGRSRRWWWGRAWWRRRWTRRSSAGCPSTRRGGGRSACSRRWRRLRRVKLTGKQSHKHSLLPLYVLSPCAAVLWNVYSVRLWQWHIQNLQIFS